MPALMAGGRAAFGTEPDGSPVTEAGAGKPAVEELAGALLMQASGQSGT